MVTLQIGNYPCYLLNEEDRTNDTPLPDFINYQLAIYETTQRIGELDVPTFSYRALCENISCTTCLLSKPCGNGNNITQAIVSYLNEHNPEFIL